VAQRFSIGDKNLSLGMKRFEVARVTYPLSVLLGVLKEREKNNEDGGGATEKKRMTRIANRYPGEKPKQPIAVIKRATIDSSVHQIMRVGGKTDAF
jgi:hypothetical protein